MLRHCVAVLIFLNFSLCPPFLVASTFNKKVTWLPGITVAKLNVHTRVAADFTEHLLCAKHCASFTPHNNLVAQVCIVSG